MRGTLSAAFWCLHQKLCLSLLYFNKNLSHKSSEWSSLIIGPRLNSSSLEVKNPGVFHGSATTFQNVGCFDCVSCLLYFVCLVTQLCLTLCGSLDCRPPDSSVHGIFQERMLEWVAISFSSGSSLPRDQTHISYVSCTAGISFNPWVIRESLSYSSFLFYHHCRD